MIKKKLKFEITEKFKLRTKNKKTLNRFLSTLLIIFSKIKTFFLFLQVKEFKPLKNINEILKYKKTNLV